MGLGVLMVSGRRRVPLPPASMSPFMPLRLTWVPSKLREVHPSGCRSVSPRAYFADSRKSARWDTAPTAERYASRDLVCTQAPTVARLPQHLYQNLEPALCSCTKISAMNLPNGLTLIRIFLVPLLVTVLLTRYDMLIAVLIFLAASVTD